MTRQEIDGILNHWSYEKALQAYLPHCNNAPLATMLSRGENSFNTRKLRQALVDLQNTLPKTSGEEVPLNEGVPRQRRGGGGLSNHQQEYRNAPPAVRLLISQRLALHNEAVLLKSQLSQLEQPARGEACLRITEIKVVLVPALWQKLDHWREHGQLPKEPEPVVYQYQDNAEKARRLRTLRTYTSRSTYAAKYQTEHEALEAENKANPFM